MTVPKIARASTEVQLDPLRAFQVFTQEIAFWWKRGTPFWMDGRLGVAYRFEPGEGGRLIEVYDEKTGEGLEIGRITVWEPGHLLAFTWRLPDWKEGTASEVVVRFVPITIGTRVELSHDFSKAGPHASEADGYGGGWNTLLGFFAQRAHTDRSP